MMISLELLGSWLRSRCSTERGASLVEYALLLALIAVVCIATVTVMGENLNDNVDESKTSIFGG